MKVSYFRALFAAGLLSAISDRAHGGIEPEAVTSGARTLDQETVKRQLRTSNSGVLKMSEEGLNQLTQAIIHIRPLQQPIETKNKIFAEYNQHMIRLFGPNWLQPDLPTDQMVVDAAVKQLPDVGLAEKLIMVQGGVMFHSGMATAVQQKLFNEIRILESIPDQSFDWKLPESIPPTSDKATFFQHAHTRYLKYCSNQQLRHGPDRFVEAFT
uniref:RxLR effector candidate protein n=1 Tax=Hyaloperonospora arabidopsidis (strain Emoy2) TaxID=559515 RepID=M4BBL6_HYAAE